MELIQGGNVNTGDVIGMISGFAYDAISAATLATDSFTNNILQPTTSSVSFIPLSTPIPSVGSVEKPSKPIITQDVRLGPGDINIDAIPLTSIVPPEFDVGDVELNLPSPPSPVNSVIPDRSSIDPTFILPTSPSTTLPSVPTIESLNIPTSLGLDLPIFNTTLPTSNDIVVPGTTFSFTEDLYSSDLLDQVKSVLQTRLQGGSGLSPIVEAAIWNRGRDREHTSSLQAERVLLVERSQTGFSRPPGSTAAALDRVMQETQSKMIELSREIMIKQAEMEQENLKHTIQQVITLEDTLIKTNQLINQRAFEVAKYLQDYAVELYKVAVSRYNSQLEAYKASATVYQTRIQAELSKIEIFKAEIEAEKIKGTINEQNIRIYLAQIEGVKADADIYRTLVSAASEKLKGEQLKLEIYKTDIMAFGEIAKAKASEYTIYSEQIKGELAKVQITESKIKGYASRIEGYAAQSNVAIKSAELDYNLQELKIKKYMADSDAYVKKVQADQSIYQSAVDLYKGEVQMYIGDISKVNTAAELSIKQAENTILQNKHAADIGIENARISLAAVQGSYNALIEQAKAAGSIQAQIASSSLSAVHVGLSATSNYGTSYNNSRTVTQSLDSD